MLGRGGHRVTAADSDAHAAGFYSRYASARFVHPRVDTEPEQFVNSIAELLRREPHDVVLPLYEEALPLAKYSTALPEGVRLPLADYGSMLMLHDKQRLYELAQRIGVPLPKTQIVPGELPSDTVFPAVLKVGQSSSARGVAVIRSRDEFSAAWAVLRATHKLPPTVAPILQQFVSGPQVCTLSFAWHGKPKGTLVYRNICEFPPNGGAGIVRESVDNPVVVEQVERLIRASGFHGVVGFDFLVGGDGNPLLTDANPRPTPGVLLAQRCGIDLVSMMIARDEPPQAPPPRLGLRTRFDPLVAVWMLRSLWPQRDGWRRLATTLSLLVPKRRSASDLFDGGDLRSLRALPIAAFDALRARRRGEHLLDTVATSQYRDYE
jgi:predicted ATP-grasp superfamily ATP-dependent carboligase